MLKFTKLSDFEKHLVKSGLVSGRTAAREAASTLRNAISPSAAVRLLSRRFMNANDIAELSKGSIDLFWKGKQYIGWDGQPVNVAKQIAEGRKSDPFDVVRASLMKLQLELVGIEAHVLGIKTVSKLMKSSGFGAVYKFAPSDTGAIKGIASTETMDSYRHVVVRGAFSDAIKDRGLQGPRGIKLLLDHDWSKPAGAITRLAYNGGNLEIAGQLSLDIPYVKDRYAAIKAVGGHSFSVGFMLQDYEFKKDAQGNEYMLIKRGDLFEVSMVPFPANEQAVMQ